MFGKPQWFKPKTFGWGLHPVTWQGWTGPGTWLSVMLLPFVGFISQRDMRLEAFIWLGTSLSVMLMDVWQILRAMNPPAPKAAVRPAPSPAPVPAATPADDGIVFLGDAQTQALGREISTFA